MGALELQLCPCGAPCLPGRRRCPECRRAKKRAVSYCGFDSASDVADSEGHGFEWGAALNGFSPERLELLPPQRVLDDSDYWTHPDSWDENDEVHLKATGYLPPREPTHHRGDAHWMRQAPDEMERDATGRFLKRGRR